MPIIKAFQGTILVEGNTRSGINTADTVIYSWKLTAYGSTIGELLDNLVEASVTLTNDVFSWTASNKPKDYALNEDYWYMHIVHPEILETSIDDPKTHDKDTGSGSSLSDIDHIVRFASLIRHLHVQMTATSLLLEQRNATSEIIDEPAIPYDGIYDVTSFSEMTKFGFTGKELDSILEAGEKEGRVKQHLDTLDLLRGYRKQKTEQLKQPKQTLWSRFKAHLDASTRAHYSEKKN